MSDAGLHDPAPTYVNSLAVPWERFKADTGRINSVSAFFIELR
jgi:hypothetical protein